MSLLMSNSNVRLTSLARKVFDKHFLLDPNLESEYDDRRKKLMYNDILYNLGYLDTAIQFDDEMIFNDYAVWIYQLLCYIMKDLSKDRIKNQMVMHYNLLREALVEVLNEADAEKAVVFINNAISLTEKESADFKPYAAFNLGKYVDVKQKYLDLLLAGDTRGAYTFIESLYKQGYKLEDIYVNILQEVMKEIGNLWHTQVISVDKEHYCTSTTQVIISQFYPLIFNSKRNGYKLLACCVGSELHEMGARMISDMFEYHGWESIYLGAAVPGEAIVKTIKENKPDLIALSVTMPQHLPLCYETVTLIRENFGDIKIAVGGRGFQTTNELWKKWDVDVSTENAMQLIEWANKNIANATMDSR